METTEDNFDNEPFLPLLSDQLFWKLFGYPFKPPFLTKPFPCMRHQKLILEAVQLVT